MQLPGATVAKYGGDVYTVFLVTRKISIHDAEFRPDMRGEGVPSEGIYNIWNGKGVVYISG